MLLYPAYNYRSILIVVGLMRSARLRQRIALLNLQFLLGLGIVAAQSSDMPQDNIDLPILLV
jgi:hypothetical protein